MNEEIEKIKIRIEDLEADKKENTEKKKRRKELFSIYFGYIFAVDIWAIPTFIIYNTIGLNKIGFIGNIILFSLLGILITIILENNN